MSNAIIVKKTVLRMDGPGRTGIYEATHEVRSYKSFVDVVGAIGEETREMTVVAATIDIRMVGEVEDQAASYAYAYYPAAGQDLTQLFLNRIFAGFGTIARLYLGA